MKETSRRPGDLRFAAPVLVESNGLYRFLWNLSVPVYRFVWGLEIVGAENVPASGPVILTANHRSNYDSAVLPRVTRRPVNFMAKRQFFSGRLATAFLTRLGAFPVDRGHADKAATVRALQVLAEGGVLALYPEGTRCSGPVVGPTHRGPVWLSSRANAPIVPIGIGGSEFTQPKGSKRIHRMKIRLVVGEPIPPPVSRSRDSIEAARVDLAKAIQVLFDEAGGPGPILLRGR